MGEDYEPFMPAGPKITGHRLADRLVRAAREDAEQLAADVGLAQEGRRASFESQLWDALEEAEDESFWPDRASEDFRKGYRAALRHALAFVTDRPVPRGRPSSPARETTTKASSYQRGRQPAWLAAPTVCTVPRDS